MENNPTEKWATDHNWPRSREDLQMANEHKERCYRSYVLREMQIKQPEMPLHTHQNGQRSERRQLQMPIWMGRAGTLIIAAGDQTVQPVMKTVWWFLTKLNIALTIQSWNPVP